MQVVQTKLFYKQIKFLRPSQGYCSHLEGGSVNAPNFYFYFIRDRECSIATSLWPEK